MSPARPPEGARTGGPPPNDRVAVSVRLDCPPAIAFEVFTERIDDWWRHGLKFRVGGRGTSVLHLEPRLGGRMFERLSADGGEGTPHVVQTGTVVAWDPPHVLEIEWRGRALGPHERTVIGVRFEPRGAGTLVTLEHRGFASLPPDHPVRHGEPPARFLARQAMWWSDQMASLRALAAGENAP